MPSWHVDVLHGIVQERMADKCVLRRGATVGDVYRKVMGDAPLAYAETIGGVRVSEDDLVVVGKNDILSFK
ncbi:hypothetical protein LTR28_006388, partial [Elasticomyces elasticus]